MKHLIPLCVLASITTNLAAQPLAPFIGSYESIGKCEMIDGNRTSATLTIESARENTGLPEGSLSLIFRDPDPWNLYYFAVYSVPGSGKTSVPYEDGINLSYFEYNTKVGSGSLTFENTFTIGFNDSLRTESFALNVTENNPAIYNLTYTTGNYEKLDQCLFVKVSDL